MSSRFGPWPALALLLSLVLPAVPALADPDEAGAQICERAIVAGAREQGIPEGVLHAISLTETGRAQGGRLRPWPWAINREGQGYWFRNRDEALAFAKASVAAGRTSFDVGCFQINYFWHGRNFPSLEAMFDPETGAGYAASFLKALYQERGDWSAAAGAYHSQLPDRASVYRTRFDRILAELGGQPIQVAAAEADADQATPPSPQKSRTRTRGPKIITIPPRGAAALPQAPGTQAALDGAPMSADLPGRVSVAELNL
ncbi:MAG: lytic transglycosylase domain-containing protein [Amaricoccus sp.]